MGQVDQSFQSVDNVKVSNGYMPAIPKKTKPRSKENTKVVSNSFLKSSAYTQPTHLIFGTVIYIAGIFYHTKNQVGGCV